MLPHTQPQPQSQPSHPNPDPQPPPSRSRSRPRTCQHLQPASPRTRSPPRAPSCQCGASTSPACGGRQSWWWPAVGARCIVGAVLVGLGCEQCYRTQPALRRLLRVRPPGVVNQLKAATDGVLAFKESDAESGPFWSVS